MERRRLIDGLTTKHIKLNDKLLTKSFERYFKSPKLMVHDDDLCQAINNANQKCQEVLRRGFIRNFPRKSPSLVVKKTATPVRKVLNESLRKLAIQGNYSTPKSRSNQRMSLPTTFINTSIPKISSYMEDLDDLIEFNESDMLDMRDIGNRSIVAPPPGFQIPKPRVPVIETPQKSLRPISTPMQHLMPPLSRQRTSTPYRRTATNEPSFTVTLPPSNHSSIRQVTCNENFNPRNLTSIIEILENITALDMNNSISLTSRNINVTPGKYELYKVMR